MDFLLPLVLLPLLLLGCRHCPPSAVDIMPLARSGKLRRFVFSGSNFSCSRKRSLSCTRKLSTRDNAKASVYQNHDWISLRFKQNQAGREFELEEESVNAQTNELGLVSAKMIISCRAGVAWPTYDDDSGPHLSSPLGGLGVLRPLLLGSLSPSLLVWWWILRLVVGRGTNAPVPSWLLVSE